MKKLSFPKEQMKIALLENIHESAIQTFEADGYHVERISGSLSEKELIDRLADAHLIGIRSKTQLLPSYFQKTNRLLAVGCFCIGTNQVDTNAARIAGVPVFNAPFSNTRSVAEMMISEIVMLARRLGDRNSEMHQGRWRKSAKSCVEIRGKTLGIIGYGKIGSQVSVLAEAFGMNVIFFDIVNKMSIGNSHPVASLKELLEKSDFVSIHVPETDLTKMMIGKKELQSMKKGACLLNASRGSVVDLVALKTSLENEDLSGAAIDVFPEEPKENDSSFSHDLIGVPNAILTPHIGGSTEEAQLNIGIEVASALVKFANEGATTGAVNFPQLEMPLATGQHRILNVHRNVPGVLAEINSIISDVGANIQRQVLATDPEIGYLIVDVDKEVSEIVNERVGKLDTSIRTRILY